MSDNPIKFGTDGWRGIIAREFTFDNVRICARAVADYFSETGLAEKGMVIGYDTRFASEDFAVAAAETVAATGVKVYLTEKAVPTPVVSYGTFTMNTGGAIMITASHNPGAWNGLKIKSPNGASVTGEVTTRVEEHVIRLYGNGVPDYIPLEKALVDGSIEYIDLDTPYIEKLSTLVDIDTIRNSGLKIAIDPMYGAGMGWLKNILSGGTVETIEINGERNPLFPGIQPEPIGVNLKKLSETVTNEKGHVGIATDGDADRLGVIDENGRFVTTLEVFSLLTLYLLEVRGERGLIGRSINTSVMIDKLAEQFGVEVITTPIGFKYLAPLLTERDALIGGEESGGYGFRGHVPERDGILAALYFLDLMTKTGKTPAQLIEYLYGKVGEYHYDRVDIHFPADQRDRIIQSVQNSYPSLMAGLVVKEKDTTDGYKYIMADDSWLLIRFSGTEPLLRIYAESGSIERVEALIDSGTDIAGVERGEAGE